MAFIINKPSRLVQPSGLSVVDSAHPLAKYAVAAWAGQRTTRDALGNAMAWVGTGIENRVSTDGAMQYQTGASNSIGYWLNKSIGNFGTDDFFIQARIESGAVSTSRAFLGKGDTGAAEWMFGPSEPSSALRFYGASGAINANSTAASIPVGVITTVAASRVSGVVTVYVDGDASAVDTSSTNSLNDAAHHLTIGGADYDGTTFDNTRNYVGGLSQVIILRGIGGDEVASELYRRPWQLFRPVSRRVLFVPVAGGGASQALAVTLDGVSAAAAQTRNSVQSASVTLDGVTVSATQVAKHPQSAGFALDGIAFAASQAVAGSNAQSMAITLDGVAFSGSQVTQHTQSATVALDGLTFAASQSVGSPLKSQSVAFTLDDVGFDANQIGPERAPDVVLLGGGPGRKRKQIEKGSYLERLLSAPLVDRLERIKPEAAEVIEEIATEAVEQAKPVTQAAHVLRAELKNEGIAYREAYREVLAQVVAEMRRAQEEEEELAIALAIL